MKNTYFFTLTALMLFFASCSSDDSSSEQQMEIVQLSSFDITVEDITMTDAKITWTASTASDKSSVSYDLYLNESLVEEKVTQNEFLLKDLKRNTIYTISIKAYTESDVELKQQKDFRTIGTAPSSFPLSVRDNGCDVVFVDWTPPTIEDTSSYIYETYVNGVFVSTYGESSVGLNFSVNEGEENTIRIVAITANYGERSEEITFFKEKCPSPSDFTISVKDITASTATLVWTPSTMADASEVRYHIYLNNTQIPSANTIIFANSYDLDKLEKETSYEVRIVAESSVNNKTTESTTTFVTSNVYPVHPTIGVSSAKLYTKGSSFFAEQLIVSFTESVSVTKFTAANIEINNYTFGASSITSSVLSDSDYNAIAADKTGYVLIEDSGTTYKVDFNIVEVTN